MTKTITEKMNTNRNSHTKPRGLLRSLPRLPGKVLRSVTEVPTTLAEREINAMKENHATRLCCFVRMQQHQKAKAACFCQRTEEGSSAVDP